MRVEVVDAADDEVFDRWFAVVDASWTPLWPGEPGWQRAELRSQVLALDPLQRMIPLAAVDDDDAMVGAAWLEMSDRDNRHLAMVMVYVPPERRRRGVGRRLLEAAEQMTRAEGRTTVGAWQDEPAAERGRSAGRRFAEAAGYRMVQRNVRRDLGVPVDEAVLVRLETQCSSFAAGYRLVTFIGRWPDEWIEDRIVFGVRMSTDTPRGEFAREDEVWDEARVRAGEALTEASNRLHLSAVVVHEASGRLVAFSEIAVPRGAPEKAYQHDTLVLHEHRGHRLGTLVKLTNLRALAEASPRTRSVMTYNAADNGPMIAVNEALGCVAVADGLTWQKSLR